MFNRSKALITAFICDFRPQVSTLTPSTDVMSAKPQKHSRGKSGKFTAKQSGAAAFKHSAKKRNNIRKHS